MDQKNAPVHRLVHRFWNVAENFAPHKSGEKSNEQHTTAEWRGVSRGVVAQHIGTLASAAMEVYD
jgi:hypothetical protein